MIYDLAHPEITGGRSPQHDVKRMTARTRAAILSATQLGLALIWDDMREKFFVNIVSESMV